MSLASQPGSQGPVESWRVTAFLVAVGVIFLVFAARLFSLQVLQYDNWNEQAEDNRTEEISLAPARGVIYDRHGIVLANNVASYNVAVIPAFLPDDEGEIIGDALVWGGTKRYVDLVGKGNVSILLPRTSTRKIKAQILYEGPLKPPIKKGDQVAILRVTAPNSAVNEIPLYAAEDIGEGSFYMKGLESLLHLAFGWVL